MSCTICTPKKKESIIATLADCLGNVTAMCKREGISRGTFYYNLENDEEFRKRVEEVKEVRCDFVENALNLRIKEGDTTAIIFALKTLCRNRGYSESSSVSSTSTDNQPAALNSSAMRHITGFLDMRNALGGWAFLYGTTRSGKTYTIVGWMLRELAEGRLHGNSLIAGQTLPFLKNGAVAYIKTLADGDKRLEVKDNGRVVKRAGSNDCITVQSFEKPERALSAQWSMVFLNEGNTLSQELISQLKPRTAGLIICDFNPSTEEWWGKEEMNETNSLRCSFKLNPHLSEMQMANIESIRERGENAPVGSYANWFYRVYYLGEFAQIGGGVFCNVRRISSAEWEEQTRELVRVWGIDFGDTTDPNALVQVAVDVVNRRLYVRCCYYETATDDVKMVEVLKSNNVDRLVFETATGGGTRARNFKALGFSGRVIPAEKERVSQSVFNISTYEVLCVDDVTLNEFGGYRLEEGRFKGADHCIDATRYAVHLLLTNKIR